MEALVSQPQRLHMARNHATLPPTRAFSLLSIPSIDPPAALHSLLSQKPTCIGSGLQIHTFLDYFQIMLNVACMTLVSRAWYITQEFTHVISPHPASGLSPLT